MSDIVMHIVIGGISLSLVCLYLLLLLSDYCRKISNKVYITWEPFAISLGIALVYIGYFIDKYKDML